MAALSLREGIVHAYMKIIYYTRLKFAQKHIQSAPGLKGVIFPFWRDLEFLVSLSFNGHYWICRDLLLHTLHM